MRRGLLILVMFLSAAFASRSDAQASNMAEDLLETMPCQAWTLMDGNNWSGAGREQKEVEQWTLLFARNFLGDAAADAKRKQPKTPANADGHDVDDGQILSWLTAYCARNPRDNVSMAAGVLYFTIAATPNHQQLSPPP